jgi:hypothetical protein
MDNYLLNVSKNGSEVDQVTIKAISEAYQVNIIVH